MMSTSSRRIRNPTSLELHPAAEHEIRERVDDFAFSLLSEAKRVAFQAKADIVLASHVTESLEIINSRKKENLGKQISQIVGGAFFGAFVQGFVTELPSGNSLLIALYVVLGFVGVGLFKWGLWK